MILLKIFMLQLVAVAVILFVLWKMGVYLKMLLTRRRGAQEWVRTDRQALDKSNPPR